MVQATSLGWTRREFKSRSSHTTTQVSCKSICMVLFQENSVTIFHVMSKLNRRIRLDEERWLHIKVRHSELQGKISELSLTLKSPTIVLFDRAQQNFRYLKFFKHLQRYLCVIAKHMNGEGFVISALYISRIPNSDMVVIYEKN